MGKAVKDMPKEQHTYIQPKYIELLPQLGKTFFSQNYNENCI